MSSVGPAVSIDGDEEGRFVLDGLRVGISVGSTEGSAVPDVGDVSAFTIATFEGSWVGESFMGWYSGGTSTIIVLCGWRSFTVGFSVTTEGDEVGFLVFVGLRVGVIVFADGSLLGAMEPTVLFDTPAAGDRGVGTSAGGTSLNTGTASTRDVGSSTKGVGSSASDLGS